MGNSLTKPCYIAPASWCWTSASALRAYATAANGGVKCKSSMKELIEKTFAVTSSVIIFGVLVIAITSKAVYESTFGEWYFYSTVSLLVVWIVAMAGLLFKQSWSYIAAITVLLVHQVTLIVAGAWELNQLPLLLIPGLLIYWFWSRRHLIG